MSTCRRCTVANQPRHEKVANEQLRLGAVEAFLPLIRTVSRSKDRRVMIDRAIFPGHAFAHIDPLERIPLYKISRIDRIVSFKWRPYPIGGREIEWVRLRLSHGGFAAPHPFPNLADRIRVVSGAV